MFKRYCKLSLLESETGEVVYFNDIKEKLISFRSKLLKDYKNIEHCKHIACSGKREVYLEIIEWIDKILNL